MTQPPKAADLHRPGRHRWNHNIHYGLELLRMVPKGATDALDVGCGEGWLVRELSATVGHVVGLDPDPASIRLAKGYGDVAGIEYLQGDVLTYPFEPSSFDFITAVSVLHHMDEESGLRRMADLLRPGGRLAVVGLARSRRPSDLPWDLAGAIATRVHKLTRTYWETPAPKKWPPPHSYQELRRLSGSALPDRRFQRRVMWRYVLTWAKPTG